MDDKPDIKLNYKKIKSDRGKECYIERDKCILNLNCIRYKYYNDKGNKCPAYIKFDQNGLIIDYKNKHSCVVDEKK